MSNLEQVIRRDRDWELVIGLEVHAQISSKSKLFSRSKTNFGAEPNSQVSFVDAAMPGMLPSINGECVRQAVRSGLAIGGTVNLFSRFDRKNYFYPDLPQGYQITQFYYPIVSNGSIAINISDNESKIVKINRIHIEQDAGKSLHDQSPSETFIDLNRSGIALMEIVTDPDMRSSEEAARFLKELRLILRYLGSCDGDMEKGSLRCDANVSVRALGSKTYGTRVEIKNVNSVKFLIKAINYEAERQIALIESGEEILQETRLFDSISEVTRSMRSKENSVDYRYFPDPDLLPLTFSEEYVEEARNSLPELPNVKLARYVNELGLSLYDAEVIVSEQATTRYFEEVAAVIEPKIAVNWIIGELFAKLNKLGIDIENSPIEPEGLIELLELVKDDTISGKIAKQVFELMFEEGKRPKDLVEKYNLRQVTNTKEIEAIVDKVIADNPSEVEEYRSGRDKLFGFFVGQVMKLSKGKASPELVNNLLRIKLDIKQ